MKRLLLCLSLLTSCLWGRPSEVLYSNFSETADTGKHGDYYMSASEVYEAQYELIQAEEDLYPRIKDKVDVRWLPCGQENSAYDPEKKVVWLCTEMNEHPAAAMLFAAHELGHAVTQEYFSTESEREADDIGMLALLEIGGGAGADLLDEAGNYYDAQLIQGHYPGDPHPPTAYRGWEAHCLAQGYRASKSGGEMTPQEAESVVFYLALKLQYSQLIRAANSQLIDFAGKGL